ncbi:MAG TPA: hypothetical protein VLV18_02250 [Terriglobales bacterium]|nr:hypothetical protein [Terriglobales bacterium]
MRRFGYGHGGHCGCGCNEGAGWHGRGYGGGWQSPMTKDEVVEEMEDYKAQLEAEITALEKRISTLKEKQVG